MAARVTAAVENPADVCVISAPPYSQRGILEFAAHTGANAIAGLFIPGIRVNYAIMVDDIPPGPATLRHLVLCSSGDHMGLCEVGKFIKCGKKGCRRCDTTSAYFPAQRHYYFTNNRYQARFPPPSKSILTNVEHIREIDEEERITVRENLAKECGYTGLSILHRLWPLYGFCYDQDLVFDEMLTVQLNIVKAALDRLIHDENHPIDWEVVDRRLREFPWTAEFKASRLPTGITTRFGYWKAEDYSRFAFPASEVVLAGLLNESQMQSWLLIARMEEFLQNHARNGWAEAEGHTFHQMALRYAVHVEEEWGPQNCLRALHNLQHFKEDVQRFSGIDNYSCWVKERAVKRYIRQSNNHKNIECTFAATEVRREVLRIRRNEEKRLQEDKVDRAKMWAKSVNQAKMLVSVDAGVRNQSHKGILVGGLHDYHLSEDVRVLVAECVEADLQNVEESGKSCRSVWFPEHEFNGLLYRENETIIFINRAGEILGKILTIFMVRVSGESRAFLRLKRFRWAEDATSSYHKTVREYNQIVVGETKYISRKVMLQKGLDGDNKLIVIDFMRRIFPIGSGSVIVPYYPVLNDMVLVQGGAEDEIWKARVIAFNLQRKTLQCRFFVEESGVWIPERGSQNQSISFNSILGIASGIWLTEFSKWLEN